MFKHFISIYRNKKIIYIYGAFFSKTFFLKVFSKNQFWTFLKMSIFENLKKVLKKGV